MWFLWFSVAFERCTVIRKLIFKSKHALDWLMFKVVLDL
jgi:hypothetical protein